MYHVEFVEGYAADLEAALNRLAALGTIAYVLTNGINRWTIVWRD